jgi:DNA-binding MarR family transcriptional regulator
MLAHLDEQEPVSFARLVSHLNIAPSTLSEALKRLNALGFLAPPFGSEGAQRRTQVLLARKGADAIRDTSVLETARLAEILEEVSPAALRVISEGMTVLGEACVHYADNAQLKRGTSR